MARIIICRPAYCPFCEKNSHKIVGEFCVLWGGDSQKLKLIKITEKPIQGIVPHIFTLETVNQEDKTAKIYVTCGVCGFKITKTGEEDNSGTPLYDVQPIKADMRIIPIHDWNMIVLYKDDDYIIAKKRQK